MALEQYLEGKDCLQKWNDSPDMVMVSDDSKSKSFDCNICLDVVHDPVVTLCGHLYCWPCIYTWLHRRTISTENQEPKQPQCPVCKAEVSDTKLIPLYGRGVTAKTSQFDTDIPKRPHGPTCGVGTIQRSSNTIDNQQFHHYGYSYQPDSMVSPGDTTINVPDPLIRMFSEMVYTRVFGNSVTDLYTYPNSYNLAGITSPRIRRHVMQADKSLGRISFFLVCCVFLCLVLF